MKGVTFVWGVMLAWSSPPDKVSKIRYHVHAPCEIRTNVSADIVSSITRHEFVGTMSLLVRCDVPRVQP